MSNPSCVKCITCEHLSYLQNDEGNKYPWCPIVDDCLDIHIERNCSEHVLMTNQKYLCKLFESSKEKMAEYLCLQGWDMKDYEECLSWLDRPYSSL